MKWDKPTLNVPFFCLRRFNQLFEKIGKREKREEGSYRNIIGFSFFFGFFFRDSVEQAKICCHISDMKKSLMLCFTISRMW